MGLLRLILAFSVVAGHGPFFTPFFFINASAAVICFFMISGFYMALVLNEKYDNRTEFFVARLWRLYPAYYIFTALYAMLWIYDGKIFDPLAMIFSVSLIGQEWYDLFVIPGIDPQGKIPIAQAWSVAVELELYLLAAFMFTKARGIVVVFVAGLLLRIVLQSLGYAETPLGAWLFFNVVVFFGAGGIGYLIYRKIKNWPYRAYIAISLLAVLAIYCYKFDRFVALEARGPELRLMPFYAAFAIAIPFVFSITKNWQWDRALGELSYPIYLSHIMLFNFYGHFQLSEVATRNSVLLTLIITAYVSCRLTPHFESWSRSRSPLLLRRYVGSAE